VSPKERSFPLQVGRFLLILLIKCHHYRQDDFSQCKDKLKYFTGKGPNL
jgi:hypothetical protein